ncbi:MAG: Rieske (2Fe-2S) protein [Verrucomicrobiota bacterium]
MTERVWVKALEPDELPEGEAKMITIEQQEFAMTHVNGHYGALDNHCPHQGAPLGHGRILNGLLRCPLHAWCFDPLTGEMPGGASGVESFPVEVREDGVYIGMRKN